MPVTLDVLLLPFLLIDSQSARNVAQACLRIMVLTITTLRARPNTRMAAAIRVSA
jgi:hypothetical protein